jgi:signal transduction histidine kinase
MLYPQQLLERQALENKARAESMPVASPESGEEPPDISSTNMQDMSPGTPNMFDLEPTQSPNLARSQGSNSVDEFDAERTTDYEDDDLTQIFSRAANIIRESFEVAGCLFLDVTLGSYRATTPQSSLGDNHTGHEVSASSSASGSDDQSTQRSPESRDCPSDILGFSTSDASSLSRDELPDTERVITKKFLAKLLRRYPEGKIFSFDADGELLPSDYSDEDYRSKSKPTSSHDGIDDDSTQADSAAQTEQTHSHSSRPTEISLLCNAFPSARSVAFVPIWDAKRERWLAGGFMYTLTPARVFSIEAELSLFKAFSKIITSDVHNLEARQVAKAQADTLGSLSHELRSPLHGIMFSTELLDKNDLSVFQSNATHTIETCCRTLLDTINHLLDFSKVNSFGLKQQNDSYDKPLKTRKRVPKSLAKDKALHMHVRLDGLVEEVVNSVFAGFNFQYMSIRQLSRSDKSLWTDSDAHSRLDGAQAMEQLDLNPEDKGTHKMRFGAVSVYMYIDPTCDWMFHMQAGALRRIVMNLFGNSLKYTDTGFICVTLKQETTITKRGKSEGVVKLVVRDTGKGIGKEYLTHKLFKPFAQEDELASGTGLGLSIVKATVSQLGGRIQVESKPGVGTTITVKLPLVPSSNITDTVEISDEDQAFDESVKELKGMRVKMVGFDSQGIEGVDDGRGVIRDICRRWLYLDVLTEEQAEQVIPDLVLWLDDALQSTSFSPEQLAKTPNIVICNDPFVAYQRFKLQAGNGQEGIFEYITQP